MHANLTALGFRCSAEASLRASGTDCELVELDLDEGRESQRWIRGELLQNYLHVRLADLQQELQHGVVQQVMD